MGLTRALCERITDVTANSLDEQVFSALRRLALDGLAVAIAGARLEPCIETLASHLRDQGGKPVCSALGLGFALPPVQAALLNGAAMHVLDYEPMWKPSTHALSTTLPAALALGESLGSCGREILTATLKGIEIQGWLRQASKAMRPKDFTFHQPGMVGPLGAAVAAAHLLGLDADKLAHALGLAASRAGGLIANSGTMTKSTHCGYAASLGLESALLAARGFTANPAVLEARQGYIAAFFPQTFDEAQLLNYGPPFRVVKPGYAMKAFPCKYQTHYGIVCGLAARNRLPAGAAIRAIYLVTPEFPAADRPRPRSGMEGMFSLQYTLAAALLDGVVTSASFTDARLKRPDMQALLGKITLTMDSAISADIDGRRISATLELESGEIIEEVCEKPPGSWGAPPIPEDQYRAKIDDCLATSLPAEDARRFKELALSFDTLDAEGVGMLLTLARGPANPPPHPARRIGSEDLGDAS